MQIMTFTLAEQVNQAVVHNPHLKQRRIHAETESGQVTINGSVQSYFEKQMAQEGLRKIAGVTSIKNELKVLWQ